jgi:hypothetical protein
LLLPLDARAADTEGYVTHLDMLTIGPGDTLWTRFGHTALMVVQQVPGTKRYKSLVYNFGAADFNARGFLWRFFRGTAIFRIATTGSFNQTVNMYARMNRAVYYQRFNLPETKVKQIAALLRRSASPGHSQYRYHHLRAGCATKVRDLLNEALGGAVEKQLGRAPDPHRPRHYGREAFAGNVLAEICNDLFMGRLHDRPQTKYFAMYHPRLLATYLKEVKVPDPKGGKGRVPLLTPLNLLVERRGPPPTAGEGRTLIHLGYVWIALVLGLGILAWLGQARRPRRSAAWLMVWTIPSGAASVLMLFGALFSTVPEGRVNELMLSFPITDLALIGVAIRWWRGRPLAGRLLRGYALARLGIVALALVGHATGILYQEPRVLVVLALVCAGLLVLITRRFPLTVPTEKSEATAAEAQVSCRTSPS